MRTRLHFQLAGLTLAGLAACSSTPKENDALAGDDAYYPDIVQRQHESIGKFLADLDREIDTWSQLTMAARNEPERRQAKGLELDLTRKVKPRVDELIEQLEVGPPLNRVRAAAALGFAKGIPDAQSPLLAALHDPGDQVVNNALFSLGNLQNPLTPLDRICELSQTHPSSQVRSNAMRALLWILDAGGQGECVLEAARVGLSDPEPGVRAQSALVLGILHDGDSVEMLGHLLADEHLLVTRAAARSLAAIADRVDEHRGEAARALVVAYEAAPTEAREQILRSTLIQVHGSDLGELHYWVEWATNMP